MNKISLFTIFILYSFFSFSQAVTKREYIATRTESVPRIDGLLDDLCWQDISPASNFIQTAPQPGIPMQQKTEVKIIYDNASFYIAAMMYDSSPDSIKKELSKRENVFFGPNADAFGILLDTYGNGQHAVFFAVSAAGVQADTRISEPEEFDDSWNAIWESSVNINDKGWTAELKIPYSAIRFPNKTEQEWGINFSRQVKRSNEFGNWNPINPEEQGFIHQSGVLKGISHIDAPLRLSFSPYASAYADNYAGKNSFLINGGADVKYGINESFTLDMTLIPDFGQVRSDDKVLNLSPYEVKYDENRSFFTEGTELFDRAFLFYSRRVGQEPLEYNSIYESLQPNEEVTDNPSSAQLYNATKLSGRTKGKLGIGFFNATTAPAFATIRDTITNSTREIRTQPLSNYNVTVFDQVFRNNSFISLTNTNVTRAGSTYDANVTGTQYKFADKNNRYAIMGGGSLSQLYYADSTKPNLGHRYRVVLAKTSGNYTSGLMYRSVSDTYDNNDLGYLDKNNEVEIEHTNVYNIFDPFWIINKLESEVEFNYQMLYKPRLYASFNVDWNFDVEFRNYFKWGLFGEIQPLTNYDYYEPRVAGRYYVYSDNYETGTFFTSDFRKRFATEAKIGYKKYSQGNRGTFFWSFEPRYRFNDKLNMKFSLNSENNMDDVGFVDMMNDTIIFGTRDVKTLTNTLESNYIFTSTMSLSLRARHYWSQVDYSDYSLLNENGKLSSTSYNEDNNINFNVFTIDMAFVWQFLPGSEMSVVWKNLILTQESQLIKNYVENLSTTINSSQLNSISVKILYYLDYAKLMKKKG